MDVNDILKKLEAEGNEENREGMARYGIHVDDAYGVSMPVIRELAKEIGQDHDLALALWDTGNHEARILAGLVDDPRQVTDKQMEAWVKDFNSWDLCDQVCSNLFDKTRFAYAKAMDWSERREEFVKRAGYVLMAATAVHDKRAPDEVFTGLFKFILQGADDDRNFVKKAVNWALRQIGKRNIFLNEQAIDVATAMHELPFSSAKWIASDALRELKSDKVQERLHARTIH